MLKAILAVALSLRRIAAQLQAIARELKRVGDVMELSTGQRGTGFRSLYRDARAEAVDEADVYMQGNDEFADLEARVLSRIAAGGPIADDEDLDEPRR